MTEEVKEITELYLRKYREAVKRSHWVQLENRHFMIMWRLYDQFGVRSIETGEQYAFAYEDAIKHKVLPLILCPIDIEKIDLG